MTQIVGRLQEIVAGENASASPEALELIARRAAGSMRDSQSLLEQVMSFSDGHLDADTVHAMLGTADETRLHAMAAVMADRDAAATLLLLDQAIDAGVDAGRLAEQLLGYFRDLLAVTVGCDANLQRHTSAAMHDELRQLGDRWGLQTVLAVVGLIDQTLVRIRHSVYARVLLEASLVQICNLPDLQSIADLAAAVSTPTASAAAGGEKKKLAAASTTASDQVPERSNEPVAAPAPATPPRVTESNRVATPVDAMPANTSTGTSSTVAAASTIPSEPLTSTHLTTLWPEIVASLPDDTAAMVRQAVDVSLADQTLTLTFGQHSSLTQRRFDTSAHRAAVIAGVTQATGQTVSIGLATQKDPDKSDAPGQQTASPKVGRRERMKQIEAHPLVKACQQHLSAEVMKIDHPR